MIEAQFLRPKMGLLESATFYLYLLIHRSFSLGCFNCYAYVRQKIYITIYITIRDAGPTINQHCIDVSFCSKNPLKIDGKETFSILSNTSRMTN